MLSKAALNAKQESKEKLNTGEALVQVAIDGSWQTLGHSSLNGVVTAICGGKCLDTQVLSKYFRGCQIWANNKGSAAYETWKAKHKVVLIILGPQEPWRVLVQLIYSLILSCNMV